ncbi:DUF6753 family protein [Myxosarcina sp. GI1]|uniref:DUF6753 family protein n=1 Tax=Myxosarcina sp. GI1 TaxID=1541065 RepID=UPI00055D0472|nr:DUF6753 family protein [Myxosarcina sp. GI1]
MSNNGYINSRIQKRTEAIDRLLQGRSESVKVNVLDYMMKYDIDPENEFFVIFTALGEIETFLENSPDEIRELFEGFKREISKWADANLETLKHLSEKATITERLASNSESLGNSLVELLQVCEGLISQLQTSNGLLANSLSQLQTSEIELRNLVVETKTELSQLQKKITDLNSTIEEWKKSSLPALKKIWTWKDSMWLSLTTFVLFIVIGFGVSQKRIDEDTSQRVKWLLEKANRQDCLAGIKESNSPECQNF